MINKAIEHITKQMMELDSPLAQFIEEHLTQKCTSTSVAVRLLDEKKSLSEICKQITEEARKMAKNGSAHYPDDKLLAKVDEYYELTRADQTGASIAKVNVLDLL